MTQADHASRAVSETAAPERGSLVVNHLVIREGDPAPSRVRDRLSYYESDRKCDPAEKNGHKYCRSCRYAGGEGNNQIDDGGYYARSYA